VSKVYTVVITSDALDADYVKDTTEMSEDRFLRLKSLFLKGMKIFPQEWPRIENYNREPLEDKLVEGGMTRPEAESVSEYIGTGEYGYGQFESFEYFEGTLTLLKEEKE